MGTLNGIDYYSAGTIDTVNKVKNRSPSFGTSIFYDDYLKAQRLYTADNDRISYQNTHR